uniref:MD-2-related lipid-recognition domain-containing protein n=1 Tax=Graphocephala atropunctata TaxID=36148 RepID=A0A1B6L283_9HEMI
MYRFLIASLLAIYCIRFCVNETTKTSGPYKIEVQEVLECDDVGTNEIKYNARFTKYSRNITCYDGSISLPFGFNDEVSAIVDVATKGSSGGWKSNHLKWKFNKACSLFRRWFPGWFWLVETPNMTHPRPCPVPKGTYSWGCLDVSDLQFISARTLIYGTYRFSMHYYVNTTVKVGCVSYMAEILPRDEESIMVRPKIFKPTEKPIKTAKK